MNFKILTLQSLKARVTVLTLIIFLISIWSVTYYAKYSLHGDMQRLLSNQQFSTATFVAASVNDDMSARIKALGILARRMAPSMMRNPALLQALLEDRQADFALFNNGVAVADPNGTVIAEYPPLPGRLGANFKERDYFVGPLKEGKMTIGRPILSKVTHAPVIVIGMPVRDTQGAAIGAIGGVTDLRLPNFLDSITQGYYGNTGGLFVASRQHRVIITASDKRRIMESFPLEGIDPLIDARANGQENTTVFVNPRGVEVLSSAKGVPVANWFVGVSLPIEEAFAPIRDLERRLLLAATLATLLTGTLTWWMLKRQLSPLLTAVRSLAVLPKSGAHPQPLPIARQDEIGQLIGGFNLMMAELGQREAFLQLILNTSSVAIFLLGADGRITLANQCMAEMFKYPLESLTGLDYFTLVPPSQRELRRQQMANRVASDLYVVDMHVLFWRADGTEFWGHVTSRRFYEANGDERGLIGVIADITERKRAEAALQQSEEKYRRMVENSPDIVYAYSMARGGLYYSSKVLEVLGYSPEHLCANPFLWAQSIHPEDHAAVAKALEAFKQGTPFKIEYRIKDSRGNWRWLFDRAVGVQDDNGDLIVEGLAMDISDRKSAENQLQKLSLAVEQSTGCIVITNLKAEIEYVNEAFLKVTGYSREEVIGQNPRILHSGKTPLQTYSAMWDVLSKGQPWRGEFSNRKKNGTEYIESVVITPLRQSGGQITHYVAVKEDITQLKAAEQQIQSLVYSDTLTGLPNRRFLMDRIEKTIANSLRHQRHGALLLVDLDNFKVLNDTMGHHQGDLVLQQVAKRLTDCVREGDTVARLGGDEFVVLLEDLSQTAEDAAVQAKVVAEKILTTLNNPYKLNNLVRDCSASIGITLIGEHSEGVEEPLKRADLAMYQSKLAGHNTLRFFEPQMQSAVNARTEFEQGLREALQKNQFVLHYQPQVGAMHQITGVEALVRWQHPQRGLVPPVEFISLAEETNLILPLGYWVLKTACQQLVAWALRPDVAHLTVAVNVSARQFHQKDFVDQVVAVLEHTGAKPERLKLEITESVLLDNVEDIIVKMSALKAMGVGFSLDDFGTGYSSLSYLKRLPLDQLKIDQGFVRDILTDANDAAIAKMVVALAESLGLAVVAEGVETEAQRDFLAGMGCNNYQGYLFSRPLPVVEFEALLRRG